AAQETTRLIPSCFTPDGSTLVTLGTESEALHVFDLRAIRRKLAELGLDWDAPPIPRAETETHTLLHIAAPSKAEFERRLNAYESSRPARQARGAGNHAEMLRQFRQAVQTDPNLLVAVNELAWALLPGPESIRDPKEALSLARKAVSQAPDTPLYENT